MKRRVQIHYFMIALAIVLLVRAMFVFYTASIFLLLLDIFVSVSLIAGSLPHVVSIPIRYCYYVRKTEHISLIVATGLFICVLVERFCS